MGDIEKQLEIRFQEMREVKPFAFSEAHQRLWHWLGTRDELIDIFERLDDRAAEIDSFDKLTRHVLEGPSSGGCDVRCAR